MISSSNDPSVLGALAAHFGLECLQSGHFTPHIRNFTGLPRRALARRSPLSLDPFFVCHPSSVLMSKLPGARERPQHPPLHRSLVRIGLTLFLPLRAIHIKHRDSADLTILECRLSSRNSPSSVNRLPSQLERIAVWPSRFFHVVSDLQGYCFPPPLPLF